jgi:hypothetical protein
MMVGLTFEIVDHMLIVDRMLIVDHKLVVFVDH